MDRGLLSLYHPSYGRAFQKGRGEKKGNATVPVLLLLMWVPEKKGKGGEFVYCYDNNSVSTEKGKGGGGGCGWGGKGIKRKRKTRAILPMAVPGGKGKVENNRHFPLITVFNSKQRPRGERKEKGEGRLYYSAYICGVSFIRGKRRGKNPVGTF